MLLCRTASIRINTKDDFISRVLTALMCGISGVLAYGESSLAGISQDVITMRDAMACRGPDGLGDWRSGNGRIVLGHRRLAIIDLREQASQPMIDLVNRLAIVFNGEIYNYKELRSQLIAKGCRFRTNSDTEVLLHLYAAYGVEMCDRLRGMYAFAICDEAAGSLFLARDPFGIKPLYVSDNGKAFRFASQVKALLAGGSIDTRPDPAAYVGYYLWGSVPEPFTLFRGIRALSPGSMVHIDKNGRMTEQVFCSIPRILRSAKSDSPGPSEDVQRQDLLHEILLDSIRHHMVADVPIAVFLSAGMDSQCITSLAREAGHADLRTVTMGFREYQGTLRDEAPLAEAYARRNGTIHTTRIVTRNDFRAELARFVKSMDQPTVDGLNTYFVSKVAGEAGMKVCLSGLGGDEMFGGYSTFSAIPRLVRLARSLAPVASVGRMFRWMSAQWIARFTSPKYAGLFELGRTLEGAYLLHRGLFMPWELPHILPPEMVKEGWLQLQPMARLSDTISGMHVDNIRIGALEMCWYMRNQLLRDADWAGMAHSVEIRVPFVDVQLLQAIAPYLYGPNPIRKPFVAKACGLDLSGRPKTGFSIPVREWFGEQSEANRGSDRGLRAWAKYTLAEIYPQQQVMAMA